MIHLGFTRCRGDRISYYVFIPKLAYSRTCATPRISQANDQIIPYKYLICMMMSCCFKAFIASKALCLLHFCSRHQPFFYIVKLNFAFSASLDPQRILWLCIVSLETTQLLLTSLLVPAAGMIPENATSVWRVSSKLFQHLPCPPWEHPFPNSPRKNIWTILLMLQKSGKLTSWAW